MVVRALERHSADREAVCAAARCVHALAEGSADCQMQAVVDGAAAALVLAMEANAAAEDVVDCCMRAAMGVAWTHPKAKGQAAAAGVLECAAAAVDRFPASLRVCRTACALLAAVTSDRGQAQIQARARRAGAAPMCRKAQAHHPHDKQVSMHASLSLAVRAAAASRHCFDRTVLRSAPLARARGDCEKAR